MLRKAYVEYERFWNPDGWKPEDDHMIHRPVRLRRDALALEVVQYQNEVHLPEAHDEMKVAEPD